MLHHVVLFSAKDPADVGAIMEGLRVLKDIPHCEQLSISRNVKRDQISDRIDVVVFGLFKDEQQLQAYHQHPLYQVSIDRVRPLRDTRAVADFYPEDVA